MKIDLQIIEKVSKKGNKYKALYCIVDGVENFICYIK